MMPGVSGRRRDGYVCAGTHHLVRRCGGGDRQSDRLPAPAAPGRRVRVVFTKLDREVPADLDVRLILDSYVIHETPAIKQWLLAHPRFHLHFTPTSPSWLNLVERWFAELTQKKLKQDVHRCVQVLERDPGSPTGTSTPDPSLDEDRRRDSRQGRRLLPTNL
jgi:hypothetical protein